ncbi:N-acetylaspartate synthetase [Liparis tanakae]|uniref:N-acetylaspartate synthetase n=1 Tax=Liparis tanakae TaxID=230148 RepID=A0A4Z2F4K1_9TELE|nr:N-acetylaspartate synthetase [Liparis tanakae]
MFSPAKEIQFDMEEKMQRKDVRNDFKRPTIRHGVITIKVREFESADTREVQQIVHDGMMEMIVDTAFRGLRHHPESLLLYAAMTAACVAITTSWWVIGLFLASLLFGRYFYSRRVIHRNLEHAMTDMENIQEFYMKPPDRCLWVAVLEDRVVGVVAAVGQQEPGGAVQLQRMSVDRRYRRLGIGTLLGRQVVEFAVTRGYSSLTLGTTAYVARTHLLYQGLGFRHVGSTNGHATPGARRDVLEWMFYRVRHHHYKLNCTKQYKIADM